MAKIYEVFIKNVSFDRMHILAEDEETARNMAETLVDNGTGERDESYSDYYYEVTEANEVKEDALEPRDKAQAEANTAEYKESAED